jgi:hypothetical protein
LALLKEIRDRCHIKASASYGEESLSEILDPLQPAASALLADHWRLADEVRIAIVDHEES